MAQPVLTVFGGPNGSGKSSLTRILAERGTPIPSYGNADDLARTLDGTPSERALAAQRRIAHLRDEAIRERTDFTYETVMSHPSHVEAMIRARRAGIFVKLIFVTTDDPEINVHRVAQRVQAGGHDVPTERVRDRYRRVMDEQLFAASMIASESLIFDNSLPGGPARPVAHILQRFAWLWRQPKIAWPGPALTDRLIASGDFTVSWR